MSLFRKEAAKRPDPNRIGVLLLNLGTPKSPKPKHVRKFLKHFLSDRRVIEMHPLLWRPILHGPILTFRPRRSGKIYQRIWTEDGSPLLLETAALAQALAQELATAQTSIPVEFACTYGHPSVESALGKLKAAGAGKIIALPLYPQYAASSSGASLDALWRELLRQRNQPDVQTIAHYGAHPAYIKSLAKSVRMHWEAQGRADHILFSFHGIPQAQDKAGDPYRLECERTAQLLAHELGLAQHEWTMSYQSKFGPAPWLLPSTQDLFAKLPAEGVRTLSVICPGFLTDCLETLEEIALTGAEQFQAAGGDELRYIPTLSTREDWVQGLAQIISETQSEGAQLPTSRG
ncbi:ferrochelatase [Boudabousia tangfeifanii]|uniref:Coproporphyrin III ferrochelatase n=1 Tax=Boudabousia tangfeifanii TaxID=1912795 RepID=A0A1D9MJB6_9ACTO|nr:ferrochelatase [Boudabousia tangfeifanii]AOZ72270.1 ferrochelatase [Boudabousia tangfeifanii]